ncbi:hypothetical protein DIPPA_35855 [Diplonema papillatum]|nr:hypothetical protein DIPPA_35855 [Diplonema papillatum]
MSLRCGGTAARSRRTRSVSPAHWIAANVWSKRQTYRGSRDAIASSVFVARRTKTV